MSGSVFGKVTAAPLAGISVSVSVTKHGGLSLPPSLSLSLSLCDTHRLLWYLCLKDLRGQWVVLGRWISWWGSSLYSYSYYLWFWYFCDPWILIGRRSERMFVNIEPANERTPHGDNVTPDLSNFCWLMWTISIIISIFVVVVFVYIPRMLYREFTLVTLDINGNATFVSFLSVDI
jgi:hypothetical protein